MAVNDILMSAAGGTSAAANYIEDVFSTYLYTGTNASQTITNGIDLSTKGGMVWTKTRSAANSNTVWDTARGAKNLLITNQTAANLNIPVSYPAYPDYGLQSFNTNGFTLGKDWEGENSSGTTEVSWTFRKQAKFFDVVTYTGNGVNGRLVSHNLGSTPGCVIIKSTSSSQNWGVWHRGTGAGSAWTGFSLNLAGLGGQNASQSTVTSTTVGVTDIWGVNNSPNGFNANGTSYVMYLFAHDAGGFGASGTDSVIRCGLYSASNNGVNVTLGWEPQWILIKAADNVSGDWVIVDNMRGLPVGGNARVIFANKSISEDATISPPVSLLVNGFRITGSDSNFNYFDSEAGSGATYLYIAIRRGPMKTPTDATKVFSTIATTGTASTRAITGLGFPPDVLLSLRRTSATYQHLFSGRLTGTTLGLGSALATNSTVAEASVTNNVTEYGSDGITLGAYGTQGQNASTTYAYEFFRRAPGFFDVVCYTGTGSARTISHNLGVAPELMIVKCRSAAQSWATYDATNGATKYMLLDSTQAPSTVSTVWNNTSPTSTVFSVGSNALVNSNGATYVAYLFASCPGVSKVGSYTGNGSTLTIDCGFSNGARFVLIRRTDDTGDWMVFDTARGIVAGNDPALAFNRTTAETTTTDCIDSTSTGFVVNTTSGGAADIGKQTNGNNATYIYLAIA
jgi:hypothetical protein